MERVERAGNYLACRIFDPKDIWGNPQVSHIFTHKICYAIEWGKDKYLEMEMKDFRGWQATVHKDFAFLIYFLPLKKRVPNWMGKLFQTSNS